MYNLLLKGYTTGIGCVPIGQPRFFGRRAVGSLFILVFDGENVETIVQVVVVDEARALRDLHTKVGEVTREQQHVLGLDFPRESHEHGRVKYQSWTMDNDGEQQQNQSKH